MGSYELKFNAQKRGEEKGISQGSSHLHTYDFSGFSTFLRSYKKIKGFTELKNKQSGFSLFSLEDSENPVYPDYAPDHLNAILQIVVLVSRNLLDSEYQ